MSVVSSNASTFVSWLPLPTTNSRVSSNATTYVPWLEATTVVYDCDEHLERCHIECMDDEQLVDVFGGYIDWQEERQEWLVDRMFSPDPDPIPMVHQVEDVMELQAEDLVEIQAEDVEEIQAEDVEHMQEVGYAGSDGGADMDDFEVISSGESGYFSDG